MKYEVVAQARTRKFPHRPVGEQRKEIIETNGGPSNAFHGCRNAYEVRQAYSGYWNEFIGQGKADVIIGVIAVRPLR